MCVYVFPFLPFFEGQFVSIWGHNWIFPITELFFKPGHFVSRDVYLLQYSKHFISLNIF